MGADAAEEEQFGPYLVYERLGVGGMATVHRALERGIEGFERMVALKRLLPHLAEDASFIKSFVREAKLASLLNHVNIVQIFELGRVGTEYFISMEYIDGRDVRRVLRHARKVTGPPAIHVTVGILLQLCEALDYAHAKSDDEGQPLRLVHRDISPSNLLITSAGHLKVIDFGIAKAQSSQLRTQTGRVKGKLAYMAPEAISGSKDLDARSDLWAVGVIAHELLTARPLFASKNEYQTLLKVQRGDLLPPSTFNQACPPELDAIVLKALARDPDERFSNAGEMRDALNELRRTYSLQTGYRDIAGWLDWAFSVEAPSGGFAGNTAERSGSAFDFPNRTPRPSSSSGERQDRKDKKEEDEAVEIAWGGAEPEDNAGPVVLDDIPDVSEKHLAPAPQPDPISMDDIPASQPSHGPEARRAAASLPPAVRASAALLPPVERTSRPSIPALPPPPARTSPARDDFNEVDVDLGTPPPPRALDDSLATPVDGTPTLDGLTDPSARPLRDFDPATDPVGMAFPSSADTVPSLPQVRRESSRASEPAIPRVPATRPSSPPPLRPTPVPRPSSPSLPAPLASALEADPSRIPRTKPGFVAPKQRPTSIPPGTTAAASETARVPDLGPEPAPFPLPERTRKRASNVSIGQSIVERDLKPRRAWVIIVCIILAGGAATAITLMATKGQDTVVPIDEPPGPIVKKTGTIKFAIEPTDAKISIEGHATHDGSPWSTELPAGIHNVTIERAGFKAYLAVVELSAEEKQTLRVVLEAVGANPSNDATLILSSTPEGLDAILDGKLLDKKTPLRMPIAPGAHTIVLRANGVDLWRQSLVAKPSTDMVFNPSMTEAKQRERARTTPRPEPRIESKPEPEPVPVPLPRPEPIVVPPDAAPAAVVPTPVTPTPITPTPIVPKPAPVPVPVPPVRPTGPVTVPPNKVTKLSGETPRLGVSRTAELPAMVSAKVCIDVSGKVTKVDMLTKLERSSAADMADAIRSWRYAPYKDAGVALAACFVVAFRTK